MPSSLTSCVGRLSLSPTLRRCWLPATSSTCSLWRCLSSTSCVATSHNVGGDGGLGGIVAGLGRLGLGWHGPCDLVFIWEGTVVHLLRRTTRGRLCTTSSSTTWTVPPLLRSTCFSPPTTMWTGMSADLFVSTILTNEAAIQGLLVASASSAVCFINTI